MSILGSLLDFSSLYEANSEKNSKNDADLFSKKKENGSGIF